MRIHLIKFLYSILPLSGIGATKPSTQSLSDTTKLASVSKKEVDYKNAVVEANIIFPANLEDHKDQSLEYIEKYSNKKRNFLLRTYETGKKFFPQIVSILKRYQMPEELKVLIALESNFSGNAVSRAGAVGYWQMMDRVAKHYGLNISRTNNTAVTSHGKDERKNLNKSTIAAVKYLRDQMLALNNDILLMVAAYNCGPGRISRAIKKMSNR